MLEYVTENFSPWVEISMNMYQLWKKKKKKGLASSHHTCDEAFKMCAGSKMDGSALL